MIVLVSIILISRVSICISKKIESLESKASPHSPFLDNKLLLGGKNLEFQFK